MKGEYFPLQKEYLAYIYWVLKRIVTMIKKKKK